MGSSPASSSPAPLPPSLTPYPRIELHVHLEATVRPERLLEIARRNDVALPARDVDGLREFCRFTGFEHFIEVWIKTTQALRHERDFRQIVVDYAASVAGRGVVYAEALFSPSEPMVRGTPWDEIFDGYCAGARGGAREARCGDPLHAGHHAGPPRGGGRAPGAVGGALPRPRCGRHQSGRVRAQVPAGAVRAAVRRPPAWAACRAAPHAGELAGPESVRAALDVLHAARIRHGIRAVEDAVAPR